MGTYVREQTLQLGLDFIKKDTASFLYLSSCKSTFEEGLKSNKNYNLMVMQLPKLQSR